MEERTTRQIDKGPIEGELATLLAHTRWIFCHTFLSSGSSRPKPTEKRREAPYEKHLQTILRSPHETERSILRYQATIHCANILQQQEVPAGQQQRSMQTLILRLTASVSQFQDNGLSHNSSLFKLLLRRFCLRMNVFRVVLCVGV